MAGKGGDSMIRKAIGADIDGIEKGYIELMAHERLHGGCTNWQMGVYPTRAVPEKQIPAGCMYVLEEEGHICASMVLNAVQPEAYAQIPWRYPAKAEAVLVIHTLCVSPSCARKGFGQAMVSFALEEARARGCTVMRLDTYWKNEPAKKLYQKNGFTIAGYADVLHEGLIEEKLVCLERLV